MTAQSGNRDEPKAELLARLPAELRLTGGRVDQHVFDNPTCRPSQVYEPVNQMAVISALFLDVERKNFKMKQQRDAHRRVMLSLAAPAAHATQKTTGVWMPDDVILSAGVYRN